MFFYCTEFYQANKRPEDSHTLVVKASLRSSDTLQDCGLLHSKHANKNCKSGTDPTHIYVDNLCGNLVCGGLWLKDCDGEQGCFFMFPELYIRASMPFSDD
jgi:hypothetical protein